jgi:hypothetical protein
MRVPTTLQIPLCRYNSYQGWTVDQSNEARLSALQQREGRTVLNSARHFGGTFSAPSPRTMAKA